ncbi:glutamate 5-kinase [bacterium]|nr:glutamate 5-kinase [bacterium]
MKNNPVVANTLENVKTVIVKIGTRVIDDKKEHFNRAAMESIVEDIAALMQRNVRVILVSSGAVGQGLRTLGVAQRPTSLPLRQAYAAVGQGRLMNQYNELFEKHGIVTAQILLTSTDLDRRSSYLNARETLEHLLTIGVVPIVNENDTVSTQELRFTDNDHLSSLIAGKMNADLLLLLTTVDGVYADFDPQAKSGTLIKMIDQNMDAIIKEVKDKTDRFSMGGMQSKLAAARNAASKGVLVSIANGLKKNIIGNLLSANAQATWVMPSKKRMAAWKYYLAFAKQTSGGRIIVDRGAADALLHRGKSLLATGIVAVTGRFEAKDLVEISDTNNTIFARGLATFSSSDIQRIQGKSSREIKEILNNPKTTVVIHRDNMVIQHSPP